MTTQVTAQTPEKPTFESVWASIQELRNSQAEAWELFKETQKRIERMQKETDKQIEKTSKEIEEAGRQIKEVNKNIGGLNNSIGDFTEAMASANLWEKFDKLGFTFTKGGPAKFKEKKKVIAQVDAFLENGDYAMAVEVKFKLEHKDVDEHVERLKILRRYLDARNDKRKLVGAIGGGAIPDKVRDYAQEQGFYCLIQNGSNINILKAPDGFKPREW